MDSTKRVVDSVTKRKKVSKQHVPAELTDYAKKKAGTTSEDMPGSGLAKKAARALEKRKKQLRDI